MEIIAQTLNKDFLKRYKRLGICFYKTVNGRYNIWFSKPKISMWFNHNGLDLSGTQISYSDPEMLSKIYAYLDKVETDYFA